MEIVSDGIIEVGMGLFNTICYSITIQAILGPDKGLVRFRFGSASGLGRVWFGTSRRETEEASKKYRTMLLKTRYGCEPGTFLTFFWTGSVPNKGL